MTDSEVFFLVNSSMTAVDKVRVVYGSENDYIHTSGMFTVWLLK